MADLVAEAKVAQDAGTFLLTVRGESFYDRVIGMMLAGILSLIGLIVVLYLIYITNAALHARMPAPIEIVEIYGTGGGSPEGEVGAVETIDVPGGAPSLVASNNLQDATDFEEPSMQQVSTAVLDALADPSAEALEVDVGQATLSGNMVATGRRASRIGTGGRAFGFGPGDGGALPPEQRWSIVYNPGLTLDEYARQLDALGVELGTVGGSNTIEYGSQFSTNPTRRSGLSQADGRLYFLPQNRTWRENDSALLARCGIVVGDKPIFQFYPRGVESTLQQLETAFKGRQTSEIRTTRFTVVPSGNSFTFKVLAQETFR
jgi:hypothetical protein